jgi:peptidoglycan/xylan/chitin deacetylase (PgdA/CDA1 family)
MAHHQTVCWSFYASTFYHLTTDQDISYGCSSSPKHVALTFDDGPSFETAQVLQTLAEANVTATFFVSGGIRSHTAGAEKTTWLGDVHAAGHQIESHT